MKTFEINVSQSGSQLHKKIRMMLIFLNFPINYSAGGDPYVVRLATPHFKKLQKQLEDRKIKFTVFDGDQSF